jgi:zinc protease
LIQVDNCIVSLSGDFESESIMKKLEKTIGQMNRKGEKLKESEFLILKSPKQTKKEKEADKTQSILLHAYYGLSVRDQDRVKANLLGNILNGLGSRLFINLREKKELAYYTGMFPFYGLSSGMFVFYVGTIKDKLEQADKGIEEEIAKLINDGIEQKELNAAKKEIISDKMNSFQANGSIAFDYALEHLYNSRILTINDVKNEIKDISVEDMNKFIKVYFKGQPKKVIVLKGK